MESIGEKLKTAREQAGFNLDQIARDTNISKHFLQALEDEDFSSFAGETYIIGFLRTYAEYLGLSPEELITLYRNFKIQEQPIPLNELLDKGEKKPVGLLIAVIAVVVAGLGVGGYFLGPRLAAGISEARAARAERRKDSLSGTVYEMKDEIMERRFAAGDTVSVILNNTKYSISLTDVSDKLTISAPLGTMGINLGDEVLIDLDGDKKDDIKLLVRDIDVTGTEKAVVIRLDRFTLSSKTAVAATLSAQEETSELYKTEAPAAAEGTAPAAAAGSLGAATLPSRKVNTLSLLESPQIKPISVDIIFRGYCLLRYVSDSAVREERYFHKGETFRLDASKEVRIWISNAGSLKAKISGVDVELGRPGEVATRLIAWQKNEETGSFTLNVVPVY
ncbi:MAG: hypothetical protein E4H36_03380 [Spirochaetales bacterium]|nr:MAG: hypothetical protein E4H36_03380 [Spirochaetales bacterium]